MFTPVCFTCLIFCVVADMDSSNLFITCNTKIRLLVPSRCKSAELVEMISVETKIDNTVAAMKIDHDIDDNKAS